MDNSSNRKTSDLIKRFEALESGVKACSKVPHFHKRLSSFSKSSSKTSPEGENLNIPSDLELNKEPSSNSIPKKKISHRFRDHFRRSSRDVISEQSESSSPYNDLMGLNFIDSNSTDSNLSRDETKQNSIDLPKRELSIISLHKELDISPTKNIPSNKSTDIISNLAIDAQIDSKITASSKSWCFSANSLYETGRLKELSNDWKGAYVSYLKFCEIVLNIIPKQRDFNEISHTSKYISLKKNALPVMEVMEILKVKIIDQELEEQKTLNSLENSHDSYKDFLEKYPSIDSFTLKSQPVSENHVESSFDSRESLYLQDKIKKFAEIDQKFDKNDRINTSDFMASNTSCSEASHLSYSPRELSNLLNNSSYVKNPQILIFDLRGKNEFFQCHIKHDSVIPIDPQWLFPSSTAYDISKKIGEISSSMQRNFDGRNAFSKIIYMDESTTTLDPFSDQQFSTRSKSSLLKLLVSILSSGNDSLLRRMHLLSGGIYGWVKDLGPDYCTGSNVDHFITSSGIAKSSSSLNSYPKVQGSFSYKPSTIVSNTHIEHDQPSSHLKNRRLGTLISDSDAAEIANDVKSHKVPSLEHSRSLYDFFKRKEPKPASKDTKINRFSKKIPGSNLENLESKQVHYDHDIHKNDETITPIETDTSQSGPTNHELYYVIGRQSDSIKEGLNNGNIAESDWNDSTVLRRKSIFDNPLLGFTGNDNRNLLGSDNRYHKEATSPAISTMPDNLKNNLKRLDFNSSSEIKASSPKLITTDVGEGSSPVIPSKPIKSFVNLAIPKASENMSYENSSSTKFEPYLAVSNDLNPRRFRGTGFGNQVQRASSSGPQSNLMDYGESGPPLAPNNMNSIKDVIHKNNTHRYKTSLGGFSGDLQLLNGNLDVKTQMQSRFSPPPIRSTENIGLTGLKNFGNTCYVNSVLQCLSGTVPFARFFLSGLWRRDCSVSRSINGFSLLDSKGGDKSTSIVANSNEAKKFLKERQYSETMICEFSSVIDQLWNSQSTSLSPLALINSIKKAIPMFKGSDQQDAQEFASHFLDAIHNTLNTTKSLPHKKKNNNGLLHHSGKSKELIKFEEKEKERKFELLPDLEQVEIKWNEYIDLNWSIVSSIFQGQLQSRLICANCGYQSSSYSPFTDLSVPIPLPSRTGGGVRQGATGQSPKIYNKNYSNLTVDISDCLSRFVEPEYLDKDNEWLCSNCNQKSEAKKTIMISKLPLVLILHIKRFSYDGIFRDKVDAMVTYPLRGLDLTPYCIPALSENNSRNHGGQYQTDNKNMYHLYGVVNHMGSLGGGHYTSSVYSGIRNEWNYFNDTRVSSISERNVISPAAYLLFFVRDQI
ncbi:Ubiquitin carboxyl-terminal hydrolase 2 [Smittium mucronatum]|uniref:Ubiquitin carboxyl-terminal hydrolase 2 n=1 Tax=Smittium mucronatum TaxID=133383 RepID=A0A1R0H5L4_9FUNG|nr:Ubiquitin carboxyl-terminal hydrolase 2 [Smittium mucronatum]